MTNVPNQESMDTRSIPMTPSLWLERTLDSYEVEDLNGHELAKLIPYLAVGTGLQEVPEAS